MATFLTTPKMSPELAARVEASVRGRPAGQQRMLGPRAIALLRAAAACATLALVASVGLVRRRAIDELEADRASVLADLRARAGQITDADRAVVSGVEAWVGRQAGPYEGDVAAPSLREPATLSATLARPILYLRGPLDGFGSAEGIAEMAATTFRDAFVLCLLEPPSPRNEKSLRAAARRSLAGSEQVRVASHVERFHVARAALPFLAPRWEERVRTAERRELAALRAEFVRAPLEQATRALKARLLLVAMDEPKNGTGPTEIDGACRHHVRVVLRDLESDQVLLRLRKQVDPAWISEDSRTELGSAINSCELALEVRAALSAAP